MFIVEIQHIYEKFYVKLGIIYPLANLHLKCSIHTLTLCV